MRAFSPPALAAVLEGLPGDGRLWIAFSGGLDSTVLLHAAARLRPRRGLAAVHVHHGLRPEAERWAAHCAARCGALGVPFELLRVAVQGRAGGVEAAARRARRAALAARLGPGEVLLTAHHADDQLETVLMQLLRGAGVRGLAAMAPLAPLGAGWQARPLLAWSRAELAAWAEAEGLSWVADPMNEDARFDRAWLRRHLLPVLAGRWPRAAQAAVRSAGRCARALSLLDALADLDGAEAYRGRPLPVSRLAALPPARGANLLRRWLGDLGLRPPDEARLEAALAALCGAARDRLPELRWAGGELRRWRDALYAGPALSPPPRRPLSWDGRGTLTLPAGCGRLRLVPAAVGIDPARLAGGLEVRWRVGGERLRPAGAGRRRSLKALLQEAGVPPWVRARAPLLYAAGGLVAVGGWWTAAEATAAGGLAPVWEAPRLAAWSGCAPLFAPGGSGTL
ncbi:tRNA lysidine(34) synthetase TilS [Inmirania thermothiophila]|uniref:tRNA(Ile)-lysidine synthase n=1 Tax=Inmirania thermothiophila TaxID=1750597 RepID=A0A3N1Y117_9GAMM|nr:tRNA lysidine(34) synthetase TilS [Inmirania thermothiophila]ROR32231.1 tRNA(Ile)-lysidine synthase [Inmirania thermothiophila]